MNTFVLQASNSLFSSPVLPAAAILLQRLPASLPGQGRAQEEDYTYEQQSCELVILTCELALIHAGPCGFPRQALELRVLRALLHPPPAPGIHQR